MSIYKCNIKFPQVWIFLGETTAVFSIKCYYEDADVSETEGK